VEPLSLAAAAFGLLASFLAQMAGKIMERASEAIADVAMPKAKVVQERLQAKPTPGSYLRVLLDGLQVEPEDARRQGILKAELAAVLAQDHQFAAELEHLVDYAKQVGSVRITATGVGVVVGQDVKPRGHNVAGRDMSISNSVREER
jgi:hypothetical protein